MSDTITKHTRGPWSIDKWATGITISAPNSGYSICTLGGCNNDEANAKLIVSAPELKKENEELKEALKNSPKMYGASLWRKELKEQKALNAELLEALRDAQQTILNTKTSLPFTKEFEPIAGTLLRQANQIQVAIKKATTK
jgi:hypothetical protein